MKKISKREFIIKWCKGISLNMHHVAVSSAKNVWERLEELNLSVIKNV